MNDIDALLRANDPAANTPDYTEEETRAMIAKAVATTPAKAKKSRKLRIGIAAATLAGVSLLSYNSILGTETAQARNALNTAAINTKDIPAKPGQYWKKTTIGEEITIVGKDTLCIYAFERRDYTDVATGLHTWSELLPEKLVRQYGSDECFTFESDVAGVEKFDAYPEYSGVQYLASLPRDPNALRDTLLKASEGKGWGVEHELFVYVTDILRAEVAPADLRAALYQVLADLPSIIIKEKTVIDGKEVVVMGIRDPRDKNNYDDIILDPTTGMMVGESGVTRAANGEEVKTRNTVKVEVVDEVPKEVLDAATEG